MRAIEIPISLHDGQLEVWNSKARFRVLSAGRRWGKTWLGSALCFDCALRGGRAWWIAPTYGDTHYGLRGLTELRYQTRDLVNVEYRAGDRCFLFPKGGEVWIKSANNSLRGEGLNLAILDEAAYIQEAAWTKAIRPALSDREGDAMFISTPAGRNWFWRYWQRGQDPEYPDFQSWQFPTLTNPFINPQEIKTVERELTEQVFSQEYLAQFIEDFGGVFRRVMDAVDDCETQTPVDGHEYVFGVDWGRHNDFTAITVLDTTTKSLVYLDRFTQIDYAIQTGRLKALAQTFQPVQIIAELNSMGEPLVEQLIADGLPMSGFQTTNASKEEAIRALEGAFERREIRIIGDKVLISELQAYEQNKTASGRFTFSAPEGMHDDTVMSLALAWQGDGGPAVYEL